MRVRILYIAESVVLLLTLFAVGGGCQLAGLHRAAAPTRIDRLMQTYPDLQSGRLLVIADFEDPKHMELFQLVGVSDHAKCVLDPKRGRVETGTGCLQFTTGSPDDTIVVSNRAAAQWYLKRDWRNYDLLLMSIHSPERDLVLEMTIAGGPIEERLATHTSIPLQRGWNVLRLDLAEVGEGIPLDDVQEMRLAVSGAPKPVELVLDDILLVGNRTDLFGDISNREAGLYVQQVGRRWKIGAGRPGADFELTFANGQIVEWYNVAADPYMVRNLLRGTMLGPRPVVVESPDSNEFHAANPGNAVVVRSRIVEMNAVRAVVTSEWRFVDDPRSTQRSLDRQPFQRWTYTIYPTGQIYVVVEATAATGTWTPPQLGLAVTLASAPEDGLRCFVGTPPDEPKSAQPPVYATARSETTGAFLLYVVDDTNRAARITESTLPGGGVSDAEGHTSLIAVADASGEDIETWFCHILLGAASEASDEDAFARAVDYTRPAAPRIEVGSLVPVSEEDGRTAGFDPASGCYVIAPDRHLVRLVIGGRERPRYSPAFQIVGTDNYEAWAVYVDHRIFDRVARDAQGNLIFQLPGTIRKPTLVEVLLRCPGQSHLNCETPADGSETLVRPLGRFSHDRSDLRFHAGNRGLN